MISSTPSASRPPETTTLWQQNSRFEPYKYLTEPPARLSSSGSPRRSGCNIDAPAFHALDLVFETSLRDFLRNIGAYDKDGANHDPQRLVLSEPSGKNTFSGRSGLGLHHVESPGVGSRLACEIFPTEGSSALSQRFSVVCSFCSL